MFTNDSAAGPQPLMFNLFCVCFIDDRSIDLIELVPVLCLVNRDNSTIDKAENRHELNRIDRLSIDEGVTVTAHA